MIQSISTPATDAQSIDTMYALLGNELRRAAAAAVAEREPPIGVRDLAATIAEREPPDVDRTADDVAARLHHVHLPALDEAGVVDYDAATNAVTAAQPAVLQAFIEESDGDE